jgi:hypothetical protein
MTKQVVVRSSSVEAARLLVRRNAERGKSTDPQTNRLADAKFVPESPAADSNGSSN